MALNRKLPQELLSQLIVVDIAPARGEMSDEFKMYVRAMKTIEEKHVHSRKEADQVLRDFEKVRLN